MLLPKIAPDAANAVLIVAHDSAFVPVVVLGIYSLLYEQLSISAALRSGAESGNRSYDAESCKFSVRIRLNDWGRAKF